MKIDFFVKNKSVKITALENFALYDNVLFTCNV